MKQIILIFGLLFAVAQASYTQNWTPQDSLRLQQLLKGGGEMKLNPQVLKEVDLNNLMGTPKAVMSKPWMDFDTSMPVMPQVPEQKVVLTLRPYTANTKYNWDPVYQKKIKVTKDTWRGNPYHELTTHFEATGSRYRVTNRVNGMEAGRWLKTEGEGMGGLDLMAPFTREFWDVKGRKRRARTLEVLRTYGDSTTVWIKQPVRAITD